MKRIAEQMADWLVRQHLEQVYTVTGGGAMFLNQALCGHPGLRSVFMHHEQACAMAAEGYARIAGKPAVVMPTTGPGSINTLNGVFGAYTDSIPMLILSGQVKRETCKSFYDLPTLRQLGDQEGPTVALARELCKFAEIVREPADLKRLLPAALRAAISGRPGPAWLDLPLDIQQSTEPVEIPDLEERLVSRFNSGLVARVDRPCYETRVSILKAKARLHELEMPEEVPAYIAARIDSNIRELEGALAKVRGLALATGRSIDLELAKEAIGGDPISQGNPQPNIQAILDAVSRYYDVKLTDLLGKRRHKSVALPRQVCMWLARRHTRYSLEEIGGYLGGRDHTTVLHAIRTVDTRQIQDERLKADVDRLQQVPRFVEDQA